MQKKMTTENILTAFLRVAENERVKDMQGKKEECEECRVSVSARKRTGK